MDATSKRKPVSEKDSVSKKIKCDSNYKLVTYTVAETRKVHILLNPSISLQDEFVQQLTKISTQMPSDLLRFCMTNFLNDYFAQVILEGIPHSFIGLRLLNVASKTSRFERFTMNAILTEVIYLSDHPAAHMFFKVGDCVAFQPSSGYSMENIYLKQKDNCQIPSKTSPLKFVSGKNISSYRHKKVILFPKGETKLFQEYFKSKKFCRGGIRIKSSTNTQVFDHNVLKNF